MSIYYETVLLHVFTYISDIDYYYIYNQLILINTRELIRVTQYNYFHMLSRIKKWPNLLLKTYFTVRMLP